MKTIKPDVLVIGAGPGGYPAAIRTAQLGKKVVIVEKEFIGGECLNWGCIPSKALIQAANFYYKIKHDADALGITIQNVALDVKRLHKWKRDLQSKLITGVKQLLKGNKVEIILGTATFLNRTQVRVTQPDKNQLLIEPKNIILAVGATYRAPPGFKFDHKLLLDFKDTIHLEEIPQAFSILSNGDITAVEMAILFAKLGSSVTFIEAQKEILPEIDPTLVRILKRRLKSLGIQLHTSAQPLDYKIKKNEITLAFKAKNGKTQTITSDKLLIAWGKKGNYEEIGLNKAGIKVNPENGFIIVNNKQQTNVPFIYAIGDCVGPPFFAHKATKQGIIAAEVIAGLAAEYDYRAMPYVIFSDPEIAVVGLSEKNAKEQGYDITTSRVSFAINGKALALQNELGFVKIIADKKTGAILGTEIVGSAATELISEASLAIEMGAVVEDVGFTAHPHPTLPELLMEAAQAIDGKAIHIINPKKK